VLIVGSIYDAIYLLIGDAHRDSMTDDLPLSKRANSLLAAGRFLIAILRASGFTVRVPR
jgi:hypothetical protein